MSPGNEGSLLAMSRPPSSCVVRVLSSSGLLAAVPGFIGTPAWPRSYGTRPGTVRHTWGRAPEWIVTGVTTSNE